MRLCKKVRYILKPAKVARKVFQARMPWIRPASFEFNSPCSNSPSEIFSTKQCGGKFLEHNTASKQILKLYCLHLNCLYSFSF